MEIVREIAPHIFRGYDIRGIYGQDLNENTAYTIGKAYATYILENDHTKCIVGMDNRASSRESKKSVNSWNNIMWSRCNRYRTCYNSNVLLCLGIF